jgi:hypothetical protein
MDSDRYLLSAVAELGAMRNVLVHSIALRLLEEGDPLRTLAMLDQQLTASRAEPDALGSGLDPAVSDHLASMTDDRTRALLTDVSSRLRSILAPA